MATLILVLCFPLLLTAGYGLLYLLSGRNVRLLTGAVGFALYVALLSVPLVAVLTTHLDRVRASLAWGANDALWVALGLAAGLALWPAQRWGLPGQTPDAGERVWVGPPGAAGFALLMLPVAYVVAAEEVVWRAYLVPELGLVLSSAAFALHHYHFGLRHVAFSFLAGAACGGLFVAAASLWPAIVAHLVYNALAWRHMRRTNEPRTQ
jgi:membrane protease YdiL (CAAX protease family)